MAYDIPDESLAAHCEQATLFSTDVDAFIQAFNREGVISGCAVTAQAPAAMAVDVALGVIRIGGSNVNVAAGSVNITAADATKMRVDIIVVNNAGAKSAVDGTWDATDNPLMPAIPANSILLAGIFVPAAATTITVDEVIDKRVFLGVLVDGDIPAAIMRDAEHTAVGNNAPHHAPESGESGTHIHDGRYYTEAEHGGVAPQGHHALVTIHADLAANLLALATQELDLDTQTANYLFAGPTSGGMAKPAFRALVAADLSLAVLKTLFGANTFLYATNDNDPAVKTRAEVMALLSGQAAADFSMNTHKITAVVDPTSNQHAATKKYVDDKVVLYILKSLLTTRGDMIRRGAGAPERFAKGTQGKVLEMGANDPDWQWAQAAIEYVIDGGGSAIPTGSAGGLVVPFKCFVTGWTVHAIGGQTGAITIDVNYHATTVPATTSIAGTELPNIASGSEGEDLTLTTWTQALAKGGSLVFDVDSNAGAHERVVVCLYVDKQRAS